MRSIHFSSALLFGCVVSNAAVAAEAPVAPAPALPTAVAQSPDTASATSGARFVEPEDEKHGWVVNLGVGVAVPSGSYFTGENMSSFGVGLADTLTIGMYTSPHLGVVGGVHFSIDHKGTSRMQVERPLRRIHLPVSGAHPIRLSRPQGGSLSARRSRLLQHVHTLRRRWQPHFLKSIRVQARRGYRFTQAAFNNSMNRPSRDSLELYANLDFGQFSHVKSGVTFDHLDDDINSGLRETHYMLELGVAVHWTP